MHPIRTPLQPYYEIFDSVYRVDTTSARLYSVAGTVLHTPNSTVTHACVDAPRLLRLGRG